LVLDGLSKLQLLFPLADREVAHLDERVDTRENDNGPEIINLIMSARFGFFVREPLPE
jgi:hypothetical protein